MLVCSMLWRYSYAAYRAGLMGVWDELDPYTRAWVVATVETLELLERAAYVEGSLHHSEAD